MASRYDIDWRRVFFIAVNAAIIALGYYFFCVYGDAADRRMRYPAGMWVRHPHTKPRVYFRRVKEYGVNNDGTPKLVKEYGEMCIPSTCIRR